jgi:hypothetical protein
VSRFIGWMFLEICGAPFGVLQCRDVHPNTANYKILLIRATRNNQKCLEISFCILNYIRKSGDIQRDFRVFTAVFRKIVAESFRGIREAITT